MQRMCMFVVSCVYYKNVLNAITAHVAVVPVRNAPQVKSTSVTTAGQSFIVAWFVKSYVAYAINPNNAPVKNTVLRCAPDLYNGIETKYKIPIVYIM